MIIWIFDMLKCLIHGHNLDTQGNYYYCERCGHLEVKAELLPIDSGVNAND